MYYLYLYEHDAGGMKTCLLDANKRLVAGRIPEAPEWRHRTTLTLSESATALEVLEAVTFAVLPMRDPDASRVH